MYIADLHIHSKYSRATSRECIPEYLELWARRKGIHLIGTGDFTHPAWREELNEKLIPAEEGLYILREDFRLHDACTDEMCIRDRNGICGSSGSACTSGSLDPSHVLLAIGLPHEIAHGSLRLSLSDQNTEEDVDYILEVLPGIVERLRSMSPLWEKILAGQTSYE